ncbi:MAG: hypothetical protein EP319_18030 [Deltaproteobacteria bacterium]|jgi:hypothetical protein|nr:MAG: hypothetical protein EP319_18030 [Deltaproteobacteria bacterium]
MKAVFRNADQTNQAKVFYGILTPSDWDNLNTPIEYSLYTLDENDIPLDATHCKKKIRKLVNKPVEVIGDIKKDSFGDEYLHVKKIRRLRYPVFKSLSKMFGETFTSDMGEYAIAI